MTKKREREISQTLVDIIMSTSGKPARDAQRVGDMLVNTVVALSVARLGPEEAMEWISVAVNDAMSRWQK